MSFSVDFRSEGRCHLHILLLDAPLPCLKLAEHPEHHVLRRRRRHARQEARQQQRAWDVREQDAEVREDEGHALYIPRGEEYQVVTQLVGVAIQSLLKNTYKPVKY